MLHNECEVIVTRHEQQTGRIGSEENVAKPERLNAFDELMRLVKTTPSIPDITVYDADIEERLKKSGLL